MKRIKRGPQRFALCVLQIQDLRSLFKKHNCGTRVTCVRSSCRPESRIARENGNRLEVGDEPYMELFKDKNVQEVMNMDRKHRPRLLVVSPQQETVKMIDAAIKFITLHKQLGGFFVLGHPVQSRLWKIPSVKELVQEDVVHQIDFHMCAHGLRSFHPQGDVFFFFF